MNHPRKLKAVYDSNMVALYQLCAPKDVKRALRDDSLAHLSGHKEIWMQPSFVWGTVRSEFGQKMAVIWVDDASISRFG